MNELKKNYEDACNAYLRAFCQKHGYDYEDAVRNWVGGDVGDITEVADYSIGMRDIRTDIDWNVPEEEFDKWYDYCLRLHMISDEITTPDYRSWLRGCPRKSEDEISALEAAHARLEEAKRLLIEEIDRQKDNGYGAF